jgi:hypothetical protein
MKRRPWPGRNCLVRRYGGWTRQAIQQIPHENPRLQAAWRAVGQELLQRGLTEVHGSDELFDMTQAGWEVVEALTPESLTAIRNIEGD